MASPYTRDWRALAGMHPIALIVDDLDTAVASVPARGLVRVLTAGIAAVRVAYLESPGKDASGSN